MTTVNHPVFNHYAKYYDLLYADKDYRGESEYIAALIKSFHPEAKTILELGCGTGKHASWLSQFGYDVFGIDASETMLDQARKLGVPCECGDVRNYRADKMFDVVLSLFHVASYQTTDQDISDYFDTAAIHLKPGGIFIFDVWYKPAVLAQLPESRIKTLENEEITVQRFCTPQHNESQSVIDVHYKIVITDKTDRQTDSAATIDEHHQMRYFSAEELAAFARPSRIGIIHSEEWMSRKPPAPTTWGVCFVGKKEGGGV